MPHDVFPTHRRERFAQPFPIYDNPLFGSLLLICCNEQMLVALCGSERQQLTSAIGVERMRHTLKGGKHVGGVLEQSSYRYGW